MTITASDLTEAHSVPELVLKLAALALIGFICWLFLR